MISIIVTAYDNTLYIKEALDSIVESCGNIEYELLVGIDNCPKTLEYLNSIRNRLPKTIKILFFTKKTGTYIIRNTLASISKYENLLFFDSDDVMRKLLVNNVLEHLKNYDYVRYGYQVFRGQLNLPLDGFLPLKNKAYHAGTFGVLKKVFIDFNGFEPWICASDGEFYWRVSANNKKIKTLEIVGLFYRRHETNLTSNPSTGMNSSLRKQYHKKREDKQKNNQIQPLDKLHTSEFVELSENTIDKLKKYYQVNHIKYDEKQNTKELSIIIPTFSNVEFLNECFESIIKSIKDLNCEILVGIDGCKETMKYVSNNVFDKRFVFRYFEKNVGPYVIKNTLATMSSSKNILFFDSDDIMMEEMIPETLYLLNNFKMYKPMYLDFRNRNEVRITDLTKSNKFGEGVFGIDRKTFLDFNGFEGWKCAADSDFMARVYSKKIKYSTGKLVSFLRRIHDKSLTTKPETNYSSKLRAHYFALSKKHRENGVCEELTISNSIPVSVNYIKDLTEERLKLQRIQIDTVLGNIISSNTKKPETKVDYDKISEIITKKGVYNVNSSIKPVRQNTPKDRNELMGIKKGSMADQVNKMLPGKPNRRNNVPNIFSSRKKN
jgi:glycosyltransferase involved in cell wall biosynthesis